MENGNLRYSHTFRGECPSFALFMKTTFVPNNSKPTLSPYGCGIILVRCMHCVHRPNGRAILRARFEGIQRDGGNSVIMYIDKNKETFFVFVTTFHFFLLWFFERHVDLNLNKITRQIFQFMV